MIQCPHCERTRKAQVDLGGCAAEPEEPFYAYHQALVQAARELAAAGVPYSRIARFLVADRNQIVNWCGPAPYQHLVDYRPVEDVFYPARPAGLLNVLPSNFPVRIRRQPDSNPQIG